MSGADIICGLCGKGVHEVIERSVAGFAVYRCGGCDYAFVHPLPPAQQLTEAYDPDYYADWVGPQARHRKRLWRRRAERVLRSLHAGKLLDVGCGEGSFLSAARNLGWTVSGTEISAAGCRMAESQWSIPVFCGSLEQAAFPAGHFDVVSLWHVIEHVPDPLATMKEVARIAKPGARIVVACPNRRAYLYHFAYWLGRGRRPHLFHPDDRELHLSHFTMASLRRLLESCGLRVTQSGVDCGHVQAAKYAVDLAASAWHRLTGFVWSDAMEIWAQKPSR